MSESSATTLTRSTCCYCGVGCGVLIESDGTRVINVTGDPQHPANLGKLCTKGSTLHLSAKTLDQRILYPELRSTRQTERQRSNWGSTIDFLADKFANIIQQHGPDAVAFYISGQLLTEDYYVFNKLAKGLIGTNNVDTNSRLCMSSAVSGYKLTLGADSVPTCYEDIDHADVMLIAGSNMAWAHPILFRRVEAAKARNPDLKIIVIDPRRTDTAAMADIHLPLMPGTDIALYNAILHVLAGENLIDQDFIRDHTEGFAVLRQSLRHYSPETVAKICGLDANDIVKVARLLGKKGARVLSFYCMGLNQSAHGSANNAALINLHLATGKIGKPGCGPFSLTGQPNAMGGREVGGMANLLSAHRDLANPKHRAEVARLWGVKNVPEKPGKTAVEMFDAIKRGEIKAVWIVCTNPVHSMPNQQEVVDALKKAELVVVQECFSNTDTVPYADVLLPATTWAEKEGTVTNSERCISHVSQAVASPGETRHDWEIATVFARALARRLNKSIELFPYTDAESVFEEHKTTTLGRDLDIGALSYAVLDERGPQQWPFSKPKKRLKHFFTGQEVPVPLSGKARLYEDKCFATENGLARFYLAKHIPVADDIDEQFPLRLITGRLRDQWHGTSRTGRVSRLHAHSEEAVLDMHADDMAHLSLNDGDVVEMRSRRGNLRVRVATASSVKQGQVFLPMHWSAQMMTGAGANVLTTDAVDPLSRQPELKHAAVQVKKLHLPWRILLMMDGNIMQLREQLQPWLQRFSYASMTQFGRERDYLMFQAWHEAMPELDLDDLDKVAGLDDVVTTASYSDAKRGISKKARIENNRLCAVRLTGEVMAEKWLRELIQEERAVDVLRPWLFSPLSTPPVNTVSRGRIICSCMNVSEKEIIAGIGQGADLEKLKEKLKCGTGCGSCVPELKQMLQLKPVISPLSAAPGR